MIIRRVVYFAVCLVALSGAAQVEKIEEKFKSMPKNEETILWLLDSAFSFSGNDPFVMQSLAAIALNSANDLNSDLGRARANHVIGISYWELDIYEKSIEYYIEALKYYEIIGSERGQAYINVNIGNLLKDLEQPDRAKPYFLKAITFMKLMNDSINLGKTYANLGVVQKQLHGKDSALLFYKYSLEIRQKLNDSIGTASVLNNIANLYFDSEEVLITSKEEATSAYAYLVQALQFINEGDRDVTFGRINANLGAILYRLGRTDEALGYLEKSLRLGIETDSKVIQQISYGYLADIYKGKGDFQKAIDLYAKETELDKERRNKEVSNEIENLNIKYETVQKEKQLAELAQQSAIDRGVRNILIISIVSVLVITVLIIGYVLQKKKKDKLISLLEVQKLKDEINSKNKEITSYTISFLQKNQLMEELKMQINEMKKTSDISTNKELTRFNRIVDSTFRSDEEWKTFEVTFNQMHDDFFTELKQAYPDISNAELKLCALLRLNMNLKESAKMLGIAPDSVKTARYRLRKKLKLKTEDNLIDFLFQFEKNHVSS
ncbi:tetratricopeptide repeat protein [Ekhidna sp.]